MDTSRGPVAAALDIGSNTIKMLVVEKTDNGLKFIAKTTSETRISEGISKEHPELTELSMSRAIDVIKDLYREILTHNPDHLRIVATSAVREAQNQAAFKDRVYQAVDQKIDVISGDEEAQLIGRGVLTDPALRHQKEIIKK